MRSSFKKNSSKKRTFILSFLVLLLCLSIGYASLSQSIKLNAVANVNKMTWDVHLENVVVHSGSVSTSTPVISDDKAGITFSVTFKQPNEYYEFYVDVVNKGTIDAQVESIFKTSLTTAQAKYMDYKITYKDETEIQPNDVLKSGEKETLKVLVYIKDLHTSLYPTINTTLTLEGKINYIQKNDDGIIRNKNSLYEQIVKETQSDTGINFGAISSDTNGKGVYTLSRTKSYAYPIYYYRGAVTNNNVLFGNFCWKMIRTTTTGGIKLIYNGVPSNGTCNNKGAVSTIIGSSAFNTELNDPKYVGYMYDDNTKDSTIKEVVDTWFANNMLDYLPYLEDTPFYNERDYVENAGGFSMAFAPRQRIWGNGTTTAEAIANTTIKLGATNVSDIFTISSDMGNGALTYPVGLITSDEVVIAGGRARISDSDTGANRSYYLYTGSWYWTMSPYCISNASAFLIPTGDAMSVGLATNNGGIRPVIALQSNTLYISGNGTSDLPYQIIN